MLFFQNTLTKGRIEVLPQEFLVLEVAGRQKRKKNYKNIQMFIFKKRYSSLKPLIQYHYAYTTKNRVSVPTKLTSWLYKPGICYPQLHGKEQIVETYLNFSLILCSITLNGIMKRNTCISQFVWNYYIIYIRLF